MNKTVNRRDFLRNASLLTVGGMLASTGCNAASSSENSNAQTTDRKNYGLQIYSLAREVYQGNIAENLKKVHDMGYSYLEMSGYNQENKSFGGDNYGRPVDGYALVPMADFKKMASDAGLEIRSSHLVPTNGSLRDANSAENRVAISEWWKKAADHHAEIGIQMILQANMQLASRNIPEVKRVCDTFNDAGKSAKEAGINWGFHNHSSEFAWISQDSENYTLTVRPPGSAGGGPGGQQQPSPYVMIQTEYINNTDPSLVFFELDVYWTVMGFQDPVEWLRNYPSRIQALHIKDRGVLGQSGMMNFEQIFKQAYANNINHFFVELERVPSGTQFESVKACADYLNAALFVR